MDSIENKQISNNLMIFGIIILVIGILSITYYFMNKKSYLSYPSEAVNSSGQTVGPVVPTMGPMEPYVGKAYPPVNLDPSNVYRLVPDSGEGWNFNRTYLKNQDYGNGQYDMAMSSCWYSINPARNVWSIFNAEGQGWLSGGGYVATTGLPTGSGGVTNIVDNSSKWKFLNSKDVSYDRSIFGEWVQVTFPQAMDFNTLFLIQTPNGGYPSIIDFAIVANNDKSLSNSAIWKSQSPLVPDTPPVVAGPTFTPFPTRELPTDPSPTIPVKRNELFNDSVWTLLAEFKNLDKVNNRKLSLPFDNKVKYNTYRLIVTKTDGQLSSATIDYVRFYKI